MAKFNLNSNLENEFFKETFKFCKGCGCQTNQRAKFCIECGSKEFFDSLVEYKLNKELYCVKCLAKKEKNSNKCEYCGHDEFLNGNLAYFEMSRKYIDELNNKSVVLESDVINLRNESLDIDSKIKKTQTNLKKYNKEIINLSSNDSSDYNDKINSLNQEIDKYDNLIEQQKETNKSMLKMVSNQEAKKENEEKAYNELETNYLLLIDEVDELEKEINILQQEKDNYKFRIELINNRNKNMKNRTIVELLEGIINYKLLIVLLKRNKIHNDKKWDEITYQDKNCFANDLVSLSLNIIGTNSFDKSQICTGGILLKEINLNTMESIKTKGLYITGELLDVDGDCGGYNLTWAWITGMLAGKNV